MQKTSEEYRSQQKTLGHAFLMLSGTLISRILGLFRDMLIGALFTRTQTDAFLVAFRLPNFLRRFLGEGGISVSLLPQLSRNLALSPDGTKPKEFMNSVYTVLLSIVSMVSLIALVFMDSFLTYLFEGSQYGEVEGKLDMTVLMARIVFVHFFLVANYAFFMGVANALGRFFLPALAPAVLNLSIIVFAFLPKESLEVPSLLLCWGVVAGSATQTLMVAIVLYKLSYLPKLKWSITWFEVKHALSLLFSGVVGVGGLVMVSMINVYFAAWLEEGSHTFIYYGNRLVELPRSLISISMGTALLPSLSFLFAKNKIRDLLDNAANHRDILLFLIAPCSLSFICLASPIVEVLFERGLFDADSSRQTALVLGVYSVLLVSASLSNVLAVCFYAVKNIWYPACCSLIYVLVHLLITPFFVVTFALEGLVWATALSNVFYLLCLMGGYPFYVGDLYAWRSIHRLITAIPFLGIVFFCMEWGYPVLLDFFSEMASLGLSRALALFSVLISVGFLYIGGGIYFKLPQALALKEIFQSRFSK